jgi:hypothetical protein
MRPGQVEYQLEDQNAYVNFAAAYGWPHPAALPNVGAPRAPAPAAHGAWHGAAAALSHPDVINDRLAWRDGSLVSDQVWDEFVAFVSDRSRSGFERKTRFDAAIDSIGKALVQDGFAPAVQEQAATLKRMVHPRSLYPSNLRGSQIRICRDNMATHPFTEVTRPPACLNRCRSSSPRTWSPTAAASPLRSKTRCGNAWSPRRCASRTKSATTRCCSARCRSREARSTRGSSGLGGPSRRRTWGRTPRCELRCARPRATVCSEFAAGLAAGSCAAAAAPATPFVAHCCEYIDTGNRLCPRVPARAFDMYTL